MRYRIEYSSKKCCDFVESRKELLNQLNNTRYIIADVRKIYKNGSSDSVIDNYKTYIK